MLTVALAADEPTLAELLVPWIPLAVGFFVLASSVWNAWWSTRGETASLRQLKAMNEAVDGMPSSSAARVKLEEARDRLALRIAASDVGETWWVRWRGRLAWGGILVLSIGFGFVVSFWPQRAIAVGSGIPWDLVVSLVAAAATALVAAYVSRWSRRER